ncbi:MAG: TolC family protein [Candidatus Eisenbacteria bacterium]
MKAISTTISAYGLLLKRTASIALLGALIALALVALPIARVFAEDQAGLKLSLRDAVSMAERNNETLLMAIEDEKMARGAVREAWAGALPNITLQGTYQSNFKKPVFFLGPGDSGRIEIGGDLETQGALRLDQVLYAFGRLGSAIKFAGIYKSIASLGVENARSEVIFAAQEAYYRVLLVQKVAGIQRESLRLTRSHLDQVDQKYKQGTASRFERLRAEVEVKNREPAVIQAENNLALSIQDLKRVLGIDDGQAPVLTDSLTYSPTEIAEDDAVAEALARRPAMLSLRLNVEGKRKLLKIEKAGMFPIISLYGQVQLQGQSERNRPLGSFEERNRVISSSAGLALSMPIFDGLRTLGRVRQARAGLRRSEYEMEQARKGIRLEVIKAVQDLESLKREYESQAATVGLAEETYKIAETRFRSGISTQLELSDAGTALDYARTMFAETLYRHNVAAAHLDRALGRTIQRVTDGEQER